MAHSAAGGVGFGAGESSFLPSSLNMLIDSNALHRRGYWWWTREGDLLESRIGLATASARRSRRHHRTVKNTEPLWDTATSSSILAGSFLPSRHYQAQLHIRYGLSLLVRCLYTIYLSGPLRCTSSIQRGLPVLCMRLTFVYALRQPPSSSGRSSTMGESVMLDLEWANYACRLALRDLNSHTSLHVRSRPYQLNHGLHLWTPEYMV